MDLKKHFKEIIKVKKSPHSIALGFAVGTFIAILPTLGFGPFIALFLLLFFTKLNKFSLFGAFVIWNPLIMLPFYYLSYQIGNVILGRLPIIKLELTLLNAIHFLSLRFLIGNVILAFLISTSCYFLVKWIAKRYQRK